MSDKISFSMKTPLGRVKGLGSAKKGTSVWWYQRVTSVALIPLGLWLIFFVIPHLKGTHGDIVSYLKQPLYTFLMILWILTSAFHGQLGLQVIIEDYIHHHGTKIFLLLMIKALAILISLWSILCILNIQFKTF